jgi:hypothetical protein
VPIFPQVRPLLERLCERKSNHEKIFNIADVKLALANACKRPGFPAFNQRSLRRMFITRAIERGLDVKVIAQWQGHRDGGKLILDTYSHVRPERSERMARLMTDVEAGNLILFATPQPHEKKPRPPEGKKYPQPRTTVEGLDTAIYGKVGSTEAMGIIRDCPYPSIKFIEEIDRECRDHLDNKFLRWVPGIAEAWARRIGPIVGHRIASGDGEFFRQLAEAVEKFSNTEGQVESPRRYLAIACKSDCDDAGVPFTRKALRKYYDRHYAGQSIDSSALSKLFKWAQSAKRSYPGFIEHLGRPRRTSGPADRNLKT